MLCCVQALSSTQEADAFLVSNNVITVESLIAELCCCVQHEQCICLSLLIGYEDIWMTVKSRSNTAEINNTASHAVAVQRQFIYVLAIAGCTRDPMSRRC